MAQTADRVQATTKTTGTGPLTLSATTPEGYQSPNTALGIGVPFYYAVFRGAEWEGGIGELSAPTTLVRTTVLSSSNSNNLVNFSAGTKTVLCDVPAAFFNTLSSIVELVDPNTDGILFWDDSAGKYAYLMPGTNITINGTTIDAEFPVLPAINFSYGDATPDTIYTPSSDQVVKSITLVVLTPFNGVGAKVSIGTDADPELLLAEDESDLSEEVAWETSPHVEIASGTAVKVFITPGAGASQGQCMVLIEYAEKGA